LLAPEAVSVENGTSAGFSHFGFDVMMSFLSFDTRRGATQ
jgi:hypothetical protein